MSIYIAHCHNVSNALNTLVSREKSGFQALSKGLIVLLRTEVVRQGVPDHGAVSAECTAQCNVMFWDVRLAIEMSDTLT